MQGASIVSSGARILRVALTGGPCGGKSQALTHLRRAVEARGIKAYSSPEVPTLLFSGGAKYPGRDAGAELVEFESHVIRGIVAMEDTFLGIAQSTKRPSIILCDRGAIDVHAYVPTSVRDSVTRAAGWTPQELLARYSLVLHLVTAADGAEQHYTLANNVARTEPPEQARRLDRLIHEVWSGHARRVVVDNSSKDFGGKLDRCVQALNAWLDDIQANDPGLLGGR